MESVLLRFPDRTLTTFIKAGLEWEKKEPLLFKRAFEHLYGCESKLLANRCSFWISPETNHQVRIRFRLPGGKGGFGAQIRAGKKISGNRRKVALDSSRNLEGKRLRSVKEDQMIAEYEARRPAEERKRKAELVERLERDAQEPSKKRNMVDFKYEKLVRLAVDGVENAIMDAFLSDASTGLESDSEGSDISVETPNYSPNHPTVGKSLGESEAGNLSLDAGENNTVNAPCTLSTLTQS